MTDLQKLYDEFLPEVSVPSTPDEAQARVDHIRSTMDRFQGDTFEGRSADGAAELTMAGSGRVVGLRIHPDAQAALPADRLAAAIVEAHQQAAQALTNALFERTGGSAVDSGLDVAARVERANE